LGQDITVAARELGLADHCDNAGGKTTCSNFNYTIGLSTNEGSSDVSSIGTSILTIDDRSNGYVIHGVAAGENVEDVVQAMTGAGWSVTDRSNPGASWPTVIFVSPDGASLLMVKGGPGPTITTVDLQSRRVTT